MDFEGKSGIYVSVWVESTNNSSIPCLAGVHTRESVLCAILLDHIFPVVFVVVVGFYLAVSLFPSATQTVSVLFS